MDSINLFMSENMIKSFDSLAERKISSNMAFNTVRYIQYLHGTSLI